MPLVRAQPLRFWLPLETRRECSGVIRQVCPNGQLIVGPTLDRGGEWIIWPEQVIEAGPVPANNERRRK